MPFLLIRHRWDTGTPGRRVVAAVAIKLIYCGQTTSHAVRSGRVAMTEDDLSTLLQRLLALPVETEWVEFKHNNADPEQIGEYLSALSNSAALHRKEAGYIVWGIEDGSRKVVGTTFKPKREKKGSQDLEGWLALLLSPRVDFKMYEFLFEGKAVALIEVGPASRAPVRFRDAECIRVGSHKMRLREFPEKERMLWAIFAESPFETGIARGNVTSDQVLALLDYPAYFDLTGQRLPQNRSGLLERLVAEKLVVSKGRDLYDATNLGAILFAKNLADFDRLARKALRVIVYRGVNRVQTLREQVVDKGYAVGFAPAIAFVNSQLPQNEQIGEAFRTEERMYPEVAIRELVANALIHQDFTMTGTGPMVEIFADRMEIANPGTPLMNTLRFIDTPPQSRNEALAAFMRRVSICEERGSGIDKVISLIEFYQLPAPDFTETQGHTKAVLFAHQTLAQMDAKDRIRACYQHACLCHVSNKQMTNASLRQRFAIKDENYSIASRIIADAVKAGLVKAYDPASTSKNMQNMCRFGHDLM
jgi:predicted HTH transcriptional regulator